MAGQNGDETFTGAVASEPRRLPVRVVVQQRQRLIRFGLAKLLDAEVDTEVSHAVGTGEEVLSVFERGRADVAVLEADASAWDPCRVARIIHARHPGLTLIGLYVTIPLDVIERAHEVGFRILVSQSEGIGPILDAVHGRCGGVSLSPSVTPAVTRNSRSELTPRELGVLALLGGGHSTRQISDQLQISSKTVENHKQRMYRKLGVQNQAHAVSVALRTGLVSPDHLLATIGG